VDFLIRGIVAAPDGAREGVDTTVFDETGDVPRGGPKGLEVGKERGLFHENPTNIGDLR